MPDDRPPASSSRTSPCATACTPSGTASRPSDVGAHRRRPRRRRRRRHRGRPRRRPGRRLAQLRSRRRTPTGTGSRRPPTVIAATPGSPRCCCPASAPSTSSSTPTTSASARCASRPTAPRPTSPPSTSPPPASSAWTSSGFLMMSHMAPPDELAEQAKLMESYGAHCVYVTDSGGRLTMDGVARPGPRLPRRPRPGHRDRHPRPREPLAVGRQLGRRRRGRRLPRRRLAGRARRRRRQLPDRGVHRRRRPARAGEHGCDLFALQDAADDLVRPLQDRPVRVDRETLTLGYAGVYSSFLRHAETPRPTLRRRRPRPSSSRSGAARLVGGQEDMIVDIALDLAAERAPRSA